MSGLSGGAPRDAATTTSPRTRATHGDHRLRPQGHAPATSERLVLITFLWQGRTGEQPVLYVDRSLLD